MNFKFKTKLGLVILGISILANLAVSWNLVLRSEQTAFEMQKINYRMNDMQTRLDRLAFREEK